MNEKEKEKKAAVLRCAAFGDLRPARIAQTISSLKRIGHSVHTCNSRNVWAIEFKVREVRP